MKLLIATQNMTEGHVTRDLLKCHVMVLQEVDAKKLRADLPDRYGMYISRRDPRQAIVWDKTVFKMSRIRRGWVRFHRSGEAEGFPYGTPARGMLWIKGHKRGDRKQKVVFFSVWFLNSWNPINPDGWTWHREQVVENRTIPIFRERIKKWRDAGFWILGGGDVNSIKWHGDISGLKQPWQRGLDRVWLSKLIPVFSKREGEKTGVGNDMQHHSRIVTFWL